MTPLEFLLKLKQLSPDTQLSMAHLGATFEMLSPVVIRKSSPNSSTSLSARLTNETALADWLSEPVATIKQWRIQGSHPTSIKYHLGTVSEWIIAHIVPMFSAPVMAEKNSDVQFDDISEIWKMQIPVMKVDDQLVGFFRSVAEECVPSDYVLIDMPTLSFLPSEMTTEAISTINESLMAHAKFSVVVAKSIPEARAIYEKWKEIATPEVRLQFFRSALLHNEELAKEIADELDAELIRKGFNITQWFWQQIVENEFCSLKENALIYAFLLADEFGVNLNQATHILDDHGQEIFNGNISHLLADTQGDIFHLRPLDYCAASYDRLLNCALDLGFQIDKPNNQGLSALGIALAVEEKYGEGKSIFNNFVRKYKLNSRLNTNSVAKKFVSRKPTF
ncbi:hypothetical protein RGU72_12930 [Undibacterium sp. 5I1]|uniref:hypothetical protein n=1 Tax=unclassified Undibacterium TaxID=2630295 RepID=UPI002AB512E3|nr:MULTISPECIES: hypothetical protein [unclassified Undibacterium]MDY7539157.1 hypothetical protein [Undibacterium sp. 5I1]MEB0232415.1 hypothetical protein [Undibacterium sp. 10I3]MEB0257044.1 hypothetical protein [Undibacterium sp. 5I1]